VSENYDLTVMGDINLDWIVRGQLPFAFVDLNVNGRIEWLPIDKKMGGSGLNFARFAQQCDYRPLLLGKVGNDLEGDFVLSQLQTLNLATGVRKDEENPTGLALIARDKKDIRFLVNNELNANQHLSVQDVRRYQAEIKACNLLYVSGYCFMNTGSPRTDATLEAIKIAKQGGKTQVIFDVVPHRFYCIEAYNSFTKFLALTHDVDILISEVATVRRFLNLGHKDEQVTESIAKETLKYLKPHYERFILRWGPSGCDHQVIWDKHTNMEKWEDTGHVDAEDKRGFGDRLALQVLREVYKV